MSLPAHHGRAIHEHLLKRSVVLMLLTAGKENMPTHVGSGTCVKIGGRYLIATVAHNLDDLADFAHVAVGALSLAGFTNLSPKVTAWGRRGGEGSALDVAWLEVNSLAAEQWSQLGGGPVFVTLDRVSVAPVPVGRRVSLLGQPAVNVKQGTVDGQRAVGFAPLPYTGTTVPAPESATTPSDIFVEYPRKALTESGLVDLPVAPGLSGSGLWLLNEDRPGLWAPDYAQLIGIETAWSEFKYLRGNPMRQWLQMVREDIAELAPEIDEVLCR